MNLSWAHICGAIGIGTGSSLGLILAAMILAGVGGSVTHCLTMCSVFVLGQQPGGASAFARLLIPYHLGRITTYGALGAAAGAGLGLWARSELFGVVRHLILAVVAALFLWVFAERFLTRFGVRLPFRLSLAGGCGLPALKTLSRVRGPLARYGLGLSLGLLPCPMILAATLGAATTGSAVAGGLAMLAFGLGTAPALMGVAFARGNLLKSSPGVHDAVTLAALGINGVILLTLAVG